MTDVTKLPGTIALDLDAATRDDEKGPFTVVISDREITFGDPEDLDWRDLLMLQDPAEFLRLSLAAEDRKFILEQPLPAWKFNRLMEAYYSHFDLEDKVRQARRQQQLAGI